MYVLFLHGEFDTTLFVNMIKVNNMGFMAINQASDRDRLAVRANDVFFYAIGQVLSFQTSETHLFLALSANAAKDSVLFGQNALNSAVGTIIVLGPPLNDASDMKVVAAVGFEVNLLEKTNRARLLY